MKCQALTRELIDYRQNAEPPSVRQPLGDEIHAPALVGTRRPALRDALPLRTFSAPLCSHDQALFGIQTIDPLRVHFPALPLQQNRKTPVSVTHPAPSQFTQTHPQRFLRIPMMFITQSRPVDWNQPRHAPLTELVRLFGPFRQLPAHARLQSFFATISCRMWRSRLRSATSRFSLPFSSRSWRSSRSSLSPRPAYFFFHR